VSPQSRQTSQTGICGAVSQFGESVQKDTACCMFRRRHEANPFRGIRTKPVELDAGRQLGKFEDRGSRLIPGPNQSGVCETQIRAAHAVPVGERDRRIHAAVENRTAPFPGVLRRRKGTA
jgi:hypothetical protein